MKKLLLAVLLLFSLGASAQNIHWQDSISTYIADRRYMDIDSLVAVLGWTNLYGTWDDSTALADNITATDGRWAIADDALFTADGANWNRSSSGLVDGSVTNAKLADMNAWTLKGRNNPASGVSEDIADTDIAEDTTAPPTGHLFGFESGQFVRYPNSEFAIKSTVATSTNEIAFWVDANIIKGAPDFTWDAGNNRLELGGPEATNPWGSTTPGTSLIRIPDVSVVPVGTLGSGGLLYVSATSLFFHDDAGNVIDLTVIAPDAIDGTHIGDDVIDSEHYVAVSIDTEHIALDAIDGTLVGDDIINSEHYAAASIDNEHVADDQIDSEHYAGLSIDAEHLAADIIDETKIADDGIDSEHYNDGSIDREHIAAGVLSAIEGIDTQLGSAYTLVLTDAGKMVEMDTLTANTVTIPPNADVAFPLYTMIPVRQDGAGTTEILPGAGVTLEGITDASSDFKTAKEDAVLNLFKTGTNVWFIYGYSLE